MIQKHILWRVASANRESTVVHVRQDLALANARFSQLPRSYSNIAQPQAKRISFAVLPHSRNTSSHSMLLCHPGSGTEWSSDHLIGLRRTCCTSLIPIPGAVLCLMIQVRHSLWLPQLFLHHRHRDLNLLLSRDLCLLETICPSVYLEDNPA